MSLGKGDIFSKQAEFVFAKDLKNIFIVLTLFGRKFFKRHLTTLPDLPAQYVFQ
jgi:hypothetical protein